MVISVGVIRFYVRVIVGFELVFVLGVVMMAIGRVMVVFFGVTEIFVVVMVVLAGVVVNYVGVVLVIIVVLVGLDVGRVILWFVGWGVVRDIGTGFTSLVVVVLVVIFVIAIGMW